MTAATGLPAPTLTRGRFVFAGSAAPSGNADGGIVAYTDEALFKQTGVRIAFAERTGGVSLGAFCSLNTKHGLGDDETAVEENRAVLMACLGARDVPLIVPNQVHGIDIVSVAANDGETIEAVREQAGKGADAVTVFCRDAAALLNFADCLPLILVAPNGAFAVVHCGWRGTAAGIAGWALWHLCSEAEADPATCNAYIGPYIHSGCFEVSEEIEGLFADIYGEGCIASARHVDLAAAVAADLASQGFDRARIADANACTVCCNDRFFSYRAQNGVCGRHAAVAVRLADPQNAPAFEGIGG